MRYAAIILLLVAALLSGAPSAMLQAQDLATGSAPIAHRVSQIQAFHADHEMACDDAGSCQDKSKKQVHPSLCSACVAIEPVTLTFERAGMTSSRLPAASEPVLRAWSAPRFTGQVG
ncbi:hypothetical protein HT585_03520 [Ensifer sp. HO-A22]|uniref:Uncharacterized protein n=1 Tax=Ensifer oleiphilus TaxID=2742698 RepID=A0A7Y6Q2L2_9HYPH|nr:hypothetical protein [Ensifer oleiphilus]NVD37911.1 hypothetical protein [Ensifer oleiphilus]